MPFIHLVNKSIDMILFEFTENSGNFVSLLGQAVYSVASFIIVENLIEIYLFRPVSKHFHYINHNIQYIFSNKRFKSI